jgi:Ca2+-binding EF-hand superfamily protein
LELSEVTSTYQSQNGESVAQFISNFENAQKNGWIGKQEFFDYYTDLSMTFTHDEQFIHFVETTWGLNEDEEAGVFKEQIGYITNALRLKLRTMANESSEEFVLRNIFKDFDLDRSGNLTMTEFGGIFHKLAIQCEPKYVKAIFRKFDTNKNGLIEFEEFANWMIYDAYK